MNDAHREALSKAAIKHYELQTEMYERVFDTVRVNPKVMRLATYKASELKNLNIAGDLLILNAGKAETDGFR